MPPENNSKIDWQGAVQQPGSRELSSWRNGGPKPRTLGDYLVFNGTPSPGYLTKTWQRLSQHLLPHEVPKTQTYHLIPSSPPILADGAEIDSDLSLERRKLLAEGLSQVLADTYALYVKTQNFHWNVAGSRFISLHLMFGGQYKQLAEAVDVIAERIRALGFYAPGSLAQFLEMTSIPDHQRATEADEMIRLLMHGHEIVSHCLNKVSTLSKKLNDDPTTDLLTQRLAEHEKNAWMLRSLLS